MSDIERLPCGCIGRCPGVAYHASEARRIQGVLENLGPGFSDDGPVRTILRERAAQERERGAR